MGKKKISIQVGPERLSRISAEGTHTVLSRALHAFGSGLYISRVIHLLLHSSPPLSSHTLLALFYSFFPILLLGHPPCHSAPSNSSLSTSLLLVLSLRLLMSWGLSAPYSHFLFLDVLYPPFVRIKWIIPSRLHVNNLRFAKLGDHGGCCMQNCCSFSIPDKVEGLFPSSIVFDDSTFMLPESMYSLCGCGEHSASGPTLQSSSNMQCSGIGMGGGAESLGFNSSSSYYSPPGFPEDAVSPDLTGMGIDEVGFGWGGQRQLLDDFRVSDDPFDLRDDFVSRIRTPDQNFRDLSASELWVPNLPKLSFEPFDFDLTNPNLPFTNRRDFNTSLQPTFDVLSSTSPLSAGDVPQSPGLIESSTTTPNTSPSPGLRQTPVPPAVANTQQSQRFHCVINGCTKHYKRKHELKRHQKDHSGAKPHRCTVSGCNRRGQNGFVRRDHLGQHMRKVHGTNLL